MDFVVPYFSEFFFWLRGFVSNLDFAFFYVFWSIVDIVGHLPAVEHLLCHDDVIYVELYDRLRTALYC